MIELFERQTKMAKALTKEVLESGDSAIDATAGNGEDTLFLAEHVGPSGRVYAFDIQKEAIEAAETLIQEKGLAGRVSFYHRGHETMGEIPAVRSDSHIKAVMFNLGYLPGGDHDITTQAESTMTALAAALELLAPGGIVTIVAYTHEEGQREIEALKTYLSTLGRDYDVNTVMCVNHQNAPILYLIRKKRKK